MRECVRTPPLLSMRRLVFDSAPPSRDLGLLVLRLFAGLGMALAHGWGKLPPSDGFVARLAEVGLPAPEVFGWLAGLAEFGGGLLVAVGLATRPAAALVVVTMLVAAFGAHAGDPFAAREKALLYGVAFLALALTGAGRLSLDARLGRRR